MNLAVVDYGMGNLRSVQKALEHVGSAAEITSDATKIRCAHGLVLPGVGAFARAMSEIKQRGLSALLAERIHAGVPTLGICLGFELLFDFSVEGAGASGLGLLPGRVEPVGAGQKLPHIGWNEVHWQKSSNLTRGLSSPCAFYHVHSYAPQPAQSADVLATCHYGRDFVSAIERDNLFGVQFHPEKSGPDGLRLLSNFAAVCSLSPEALSVHTRA